LRPLRAFYRLQFPTFESFPRAAAQGRLIFGIMRYASARMRPTIDLRPVSRKCASALGPWLKRRPLPGTAAYYREHLPQSLARVTLDKSDNLTQVSGGIGPFDAASGIDWDAAPRRTRGA
jgi:hypothetical protein